MSDDTRVLQAAETLLDLLQKEPLYWKREWFSVGIGTARVVVYVHHRGLLKNITIKEMKGLPKSIHGFIIKYIYVGKVKPL